MIFNALIGNHDAHVKNFSLLHANGTITLALLYDALSTVLNPELTAKMVMKIGSKYKFSEVMGQHWDQFAMSAALSKPQIRRRVLELAKLVPAAARRLQERADFINIPLIEKSLRLLNNAQDFKLIG